MSTPKLSLKNIRYILGIKTPEVDGSKFAETFSDVANSITGVTSRLGANPNGPPQNSPMIASFQAVHLGNGLIDLSIIDPGKIQSAISYFVEYDTTSGFAQSRYVHLGPARNGTIVLPNGSYWFKAYSQNILGGSPSSPIITGPVAVTGSATGVLLPTQGSGTGQPGQTGTGAGPVISR